MPQKDDFTPSGVKIEGAWENDRNAASYQLFHDMLCEAYDCKDAIIGHHLIYVKQDTREDGFTYQVIEEIPSADALIFDHAAMQKLFGSEYLKVIGTLSQEPVETRDAMLAQFYYNRPVLAKGVAA